MGTFKVIGQAEDRQGIVLNCGHDCGDSSGSGQIEGARSMERGSGDGNGDSLSAGASSSGGSRISILSLLRKDQMQQVNNEQVQLCRQMSTRFDRNEVEGEGSEDMT